MEKVEHRALGESWLPLLQGELLGESRRDWTARHAGTSTVGSHRPEGAGPTAAPAFTGGGIRPVSKGARPLPLFWPSRWYSRVWSS